MLRPGAPAPGIELPDLDGKSWSLRQALETGPVVLAFFKITCPTCQMTFPYLQRFADAPDAGFQLIAISQDDVADTYEFQQRFGVSMRTLIDAPRAWAASNAYQIESVPSIFLIETDGTISLAVDGFHKAALEALGRRFRVVPFHEHERLPDLRPG